jgi:hypothetical protein
MGTSFHNKSGNVFIGHRAGYNETGNNKLYIENSDSSSPLIYGEFDNDLVSINGQIKIAGGSPGEGKVLKSDANGLASWQTDSTDDSDWTINGDNMYSAVSGNVGIGTSAPSALLDVNGHINSTHTYKLDGSTVLSNQGTNNLFVGKDVGLITTTGSNNSAVGYQALYLNTTASDNSAMGAGALQYNSTGNSNTAMGRDALRLNTTGTSNSAVGMQALMSNNIGAYNSAMGYGALRSNTTGNYNTALGYAANYYNQTGSNNTIIGYRAGMGTSFHNKSGNVFIGYQAGYNETGSNKLYIENSDSNTPLIHGDFAANRVGIARAATSNALEVEGDASKAVAGAWLANSDVRIKADIETVTGALETLEKVRLVSFKYSDDYGAQHPSIEDRLYLNVIAQEFRQVFPDYVKNSGEKLTTGEEILQVDAYPLTVYSAAAVQELHKIVKEKDAEIVGLKERISRIEAVLAKLGKWQEGEIK